MLIERGGELVRREEVRKKFWPNDTMVEFNHNINAAIRNCGERWATLPTNPSTSRPWHGVATG